MVDHPRRNASAPANLDVIDGSRGPKRTAPCHAPVEGLP